MLDSSTAVAIEFYERSHSSEQLLLSFPNAKSSREGTGLDFTHSHSGQHTKLIINSSGSTSQAAIYTQPSRFFTERTVFSPTKMATSVVTTAASQGNGFSGNEFRSGYSTWSGQEPVSRVSFIHLPF
ncbi:unnamed protein product [Protopolystoma xenopodis]|uniref:Uncharacterized protein n=1 Tax=Protopolystoma xenopodis TaxID=117903 RepID=A0A448WSW9_9PLAT|nr:unnamed protein product [Protopolystoma xenopodis]